MTAEVRVAADREIYIVGTSLQGHLEIRCSDLIRLFGRPHRKGLGEKTNYHWALMVKGHFCSLYDRYGEQYPLHIGCQSEHAKEVLKTLNEFFKEQAIQPFKVTRC